MENRPTERADHYLRKADEARSISVQAGRRDVRRSLALLAAMWTALAKHSQRSSELNDNDEPVTRSSQ